MQGRGLATGSLWQEITRLRLTLIAAPETPQSAVSASEAGEFLRIEAEEPHEAPAAPQQQDNEDYDDLVRWKKRNLSYMEKFEFFVIIIYYEDFKFVFSIVFPNKLLEDPKGGEAVKQILYWFFNIYLLLFFFFTVGWLVTS